MAKRKDFDIEIREELSRTVTVKAETLGDAINQVMDQYKRGEIVLDAEDFVDISMVNIPDNLLLNKTSESLKITSSMQN